MISAEDVIKVFHKELCENEGVTIDPTIMKKWGKGEYTPGLYTITNVKPNDEYPRSLVHYFLLRTDGSGVAYDENLQSPYKEDRIGAGLGFLDSFKYQSYPKFSVEKIA